METTNSNQLFHPENDGMIYQNSPDNKARFVLGTRGNNPLIVMSINPSVGAPDVKVRLQEQQSTLPKTMDTIPGLSFVCIRSVQLILMNWMR